MLMRACSGKTLISETARFFNYILFRERRIIEITFGILIAHLRIFQSPIKAKPEKVEKITSVAVVLHNYLRLTDRQTAHISSGEIIPRQCAETYLMSMLYKMSSLFEI